MMDFEFWHLWVILAILLFIIEIFTPAFLMACFAIGALLAGVVSFFGFGLNIQIIAFSIGTLISFFGVRPLIIKYGHRKEGIIKTNVEGLIGKIGKVAITIDNSVDEGRIIVEGDNWRAISNTDEIINIGERVEILKVDSTILTVKRI